MLFERKNAALAFQQLMDDLACELLSTRNAPKEDLNWASAKLVSGSSVTLGNFLHSSWIPTTAAATLLS